MTVVKNSPGPGVSSTETPDETLEKPAPGTSLEDPEAITNTNSFGKTDTKLKAKKIIAAPGPTPPPRGGGHEVVDGIKPVMDGSFGTTKITDEHPSYC